MLRTKVAALVPAALVLALGFVAGGSGAGAATTTPAPTVSTVPQAGTPSTDPSPSTAQARKAAVAAAAKAAAAKAAATKSAAAKAAAARAAKAAAARRAARVARARAVAALTHRSRVQVYIAPHADDETLTMGAAIAADVRAGRKVFVVLVTTGASTRTLRVVNRELAAKHQRPLTMAQYTAARTREFDAATAKLGVPTANLWHLGLADPLYNSAPLYDAVDRIVARYGPRAGYNSMSFLDMNPTHYFLAYRLDRMCLARAVGECHFYQYLRYQPAAHRPGMLYPVATPIGAWIDDRSGRLRAAAKAYAVWNPLHGWYGIGWLWSVTPQFAELWRTPRSWTHGTSDPANWASEALRREGIAWLETHQMDVDLANVPGLAPPVRAHPTPAPAPRPTQSPTPPSIPVPPVPAPIPSSAPTAPQPTPTNMTTAPVVPE